MEELRGRTALVTGASSGIGQAIAVAYARRGMRVAVHYHRNEAGAQETLAGLEGEGHRLVRADVTQPDEIQRMVAETTEVFGGLDVLVNNAGIYEMTPFETPDFAQWQADWKRTLDTNLMSAVH